LSKPLTGTLQPIDLAGQGSADRDGKNHGVVDDPA
jgi:hypothetical protein